MPVNFPSPRGKAKVSAAKSPVPLIIIAVVLGAWVGLVSVAEPKGQAWASLTAPFR